MTFMFYKSLNILDPGIKSSGFFSNNNFICTDICQALMNILSARGVLEQGACLDALVAIMMDSSSNQMVCLTMTRKTVERSIWNVYNALKETYTWYITALKFLFNFLP